eukprot:NODE_453_length_8264_cov_0.316105.p4 type:complete len:168 gc:universal NODE_453_length_8264_cov_0.316105:6003-6506(+)
MSLFKTFYDRNDIPATFQNNKKLLWKRNIKEIDLQLFLPLFVDGLQLNEPYSTFAYLGTLDLIRHGTDFEKTLPSIIVPLKKSLLTRNTTKLKKSLQVLEIIVSTGDGGVAFIPFLRQFLPILNRHYSSVLQPFVEKTLNCFIEYGGEEAVKNIKFLIPMFDYLSNK